MRSISITLILLASLGCQSIRIDSEASKLLLDKINRNIVNSQPLKAWHLLLLSKKLSLTIPESNYLAGLSLAETGVCPLMYLDKKKYKDLLLSAYIYRYSTRFRQKPYKLDPFTKIKTKTRRQHLTYSMLPDIKDIPRVRLISGQGCHWLAKRLEDLKEAEQWESYYLQKWYQSERPKDYQDSLVKVRLLETSDKEQVIKKILEEFASLNPNLWASLPPEEQFFTWNELVDQDVLSLGPYAKDSKEFKFIVRILTSSKHKETPRWMALIKTKDLSHAQFKEIVDHNIAIDQVIYLPYFKFWQAQHHYLAGDFFKSLAMIKIILASTDLIPDEISQLSLKLATKIYREHRYDQRMKGAIRNSLPLSMQRDLVADIYIDHALLGDSQAVKELDTEVKQFKNFSKLNKTHRAILSNLARRSGAAFSQSIGLLFKSKRIKFSDLRFLERIQKSIIGLTTAQQGSLNSFMTQLSKHLERYNHRKRAKKLYDFYSRSSGDQVRSGQRQVDRGSEVAGKVNIAAEAKLKPFKWRLEVTIPRRPLYYLPIKGKEALWQLKID